jgi:primosomal protein N' (replication factor Y)
MVPEINLTPQLEERFVSRFGALGSVVSLHSGMTNPQRLKSWLAAHSGQARIVLGTRMAVFAACRASTDRGRRGARPQLQAAGRRPLLGARPGHLARARAGRQGAPGLGHALAGELARQPPAQPEDPEGGRYLRLAMPSRIGAAQLPRVRRVDMNQQPRRTVFSAPLLAAITERVARGEQCMVLLNRRGYAPVLHCRTAAGRATARTAARTRCSTRSTAACAATTAASRARAPRLPRLRQPRHRSHGPGHRAARRATGRPAAPACSARWQPGARGAHRRRQHPRQGRAGSQLAQVHAGEVDVLVGTQMIAKGHDFRRITLVAAVQPDGALFSSDFRAPERLFALLMQAAGRAGRDAAYMAAQGTPCEMWVQTFHPSTPCSKPCARTTTRPLPRSSSRNAKRRPCRRLPSRPWCAPTPARRRWPRVFCAPPAAPRRLRAAGAGPGHALPARAAHHPARGQAWSAPRC